MLDDNKNRDGLNSSSEHHSTNLTPEAQIIVHKIYCKGQQFVVNALPEEISINWNPQISMQANPRMRLLESGQHEVILSLHLSAQQLGKAIFQIQLDQAGLFTLNHVPENQKETVLYGACPNALFPYAAVMINQILSQAGLPHVYLNPLDFIALYRQHQKQETEKSTQPFETLQ